MSSRCLIASVALTLALAACGKKEGAAAPQARAPEAAAPKAEAPAAPAPAIEANPLVAAGEV